MKQFFRKAILFSSIVLAQWSVTPVRAATVTSADVVTAYLDVLPPSTEFDYVLYAIYFDASDAFTLGQSFRVRAFDSSQALLFTNVFASVGNVTAIGSNFPGPVDNGGTFVIDQISDGFTITNIKFQGHTASGDLTSLFDARFEVTAAPQGTPLPAALPLFAGGIGLIGLLVRRRNQKAKAA